MTDIANLTPEESFKAGLPVVLQLEAWIARAEEGREAMLKGGYETTALALAATADAYRRCLALVTAKDADRDLGQ